jgi:ferritin-like metal-binding protein YciE
MALETLADAFYHELCDIYHAEKQLTKALPKMAKHATNPQLAEAFEMHLAETQEQVLRVEAAFADTGKAPKAKKCEAMAGLLEEATSVLEEDAEPGVLDALLICAAQKVEHYEIATYGTLCTWAQQLGYSEAKSLLDSIMAEEEAADAKITKLSRVINKQAKVRA